MTCRLDISRCHAHSLVSDMTRGQNTTANTNNSRFNATNWTTVNNLTWLHVLHLYCHDLLLRCDNVKETYSWRECKRRPAIFVTFVSKTESATVFRNSDNKVFSSALKTLRCFNSLYNTLTYRLRHHQFFSTMFLKDWEPLSRYINVTIHRTYF